MIRKTVTLFSLALAATAFAQNKINLGGDISMLSEYERVNTPYYNSAGAKIQPLTYLKNNAKMNSMRVRLFVTPTETGSTKSGIVQDIEYVMKLGKRIKAAGLDFLLDFHYSDSWCDPSAQTIPSTWVKGTVSASNPSNTTLEDSLYSYTKRCLDYLTKNDATPDFVQIGNEISYGMLWRNNNDKCYVNNAATHTSWKRLSGFLNSAAKAVREVTPNAKIILHIERSGQESVAKGFYERMNANKVDYDIIGLSYYPFFHGYLPALSTTLNTLKNSFPDKPVHIVETAYYYQSFPSTSDFNTSSKWAASVAGQEAFITDLCDELSKHDNVTGLYYWFPEENGNGGASWSVANTVLSQWINRGLWDNSTHKANPAVLKLQNFITTKEALGISDIHSDIYDSPKGIFDLTGRRLLTEPSKGIYIKNGIKVKK